MEKATSDYYYDVEESDDDYDAIPEANARFDRCVTSEGNIRESAADDMRFCFESDGQWEDYALLHRDGRPCLTYNLVEPAVDQVVGDQRQMRPAIRVRPTENGDKGLSNTVSGLIRNIEAISNAPSVYDQQFKYSVSGGMGAWRVVPQYADNHSFDQELIIKTIPNPLGQVWMDPNAYEDCNADAMYGFVTEWMSKQEFKRRWPDKNPESWETTDQDNSQWLRGDEVNVAEYYRRIYMKRELVAFSDGTVKWRDEVDKLPTAVMVDVETGEPIEEVRSRMVDTYKVEWRKMSCYDTLEGPIEYDWQYIPLVVFYGKYFNIDGDVSYKGLVRNAKDPQRSYNYNRSSALEVAAMQPKSPWLVTDKMIEGYEQEWDDSHEKNYPYLRYKFDPQASGAGGVPQRADQQTMPSAMIAQAQQDASDIRATTGKHESSLGMPGQETSGVAINSRRGVGDTATYEYIDNFTKAIQHTGRILLDQIPTVYDTERQIRILGEDGVEEFVTLNHPVTNDLGETAYVENDLNKMKYDVRVETGPSYSTMREEMRTQLGELMPQMPVLQQNALDLFFKNSDFPGAEEIHQRIRKQMIRAGVIDPDEGEEYLLPQDEGPTPEQQLMLRGMLAEVMGKELDNQKTAEDIDKILSETIENWAQALKYATEADANLAQILPMAMADNAQVPTAGPQAAFPGLSSPTGPAVPVLPVTGQ